MVVAGGLLLWGNKIAGLFTPDPGVTGMLGSIMLPLAIVIISEPALWISCSKPEADRVPVLGVGAGGPMQCSHDALLQKFRWFMRCIPPPFPPNPPTLAANGGSAILSGVLRGCGRQRYGVTVNLISSWVVGLPLQVLLAFKLGWGLQGLWWGLAGAATTQTIAFIVLVAAFDWGNEAGRAATLIRKMSSVRRTEGMGEVEEGVSSES